MRHPLKLNRQIFNMRKQSYYINSKHITKQYVYYDIMDILKVYLHMCKGEKKTEKYIIILTLVTLDVTLDLFFIFFLHLSISCILYNEYGLLGKKIFFKYTAMWFKLQKNYYNNSYYLATKTQGTVLTINANCTIFLQN